MKKNSVQEYTEIKGDLIDLANKGHFDVIAHGCNCHCLQASGIAAQMVEHYNTHLYPLEAQKYRGDINKLGCIEHETFRISYNNHRKVVVVNAYTQYKPGKDLNYHALILCLAKINKQFKGEHIGLPLIGCGIAGGDWSVVKNIIKKTLTDCKVTVVIYDKN